MPSPAPERPTKLRGLEGGELVSEARGTREKFGAGCPERTILDRASSELNVRKIRLLVASRGIKDGSDDSMWRELATLYVGDCGGEETLEILNSVLSPRRRTPATDEGWPWIIGVGPGLAANFLLNNGTLKLGAGGEALRANSSGKAACGELV